MKNVKFMLTVFAALMFTMTTANPIENPDQNSAIAMAQTSDDETNDDFNAILLCIAIGIGLLIIAICACLGLKGCVGGGSGGQMNCGDCFCVYREMHAPNRPNARPEMQDEGNQTVLVIDGELEGDASPIEKK